MTITAADPLLSIATGDGQVSTSNTTLPIRPTVRVADGFDNPWTSGQTIQFVLVAGSGNISSATSTPGSGGTADVDWRLGAATGTNLLEASLLGVSNSTITFTASATAPQADTIAVFGGTGQSTTVNTATAATVEWLVTGGGSASAGQLVDLQIVSSGSLSVATTVSSSTGIVRVTPTAGTLASIYTVTATAGGLVGSPSAITFAAVAGSASSLTFATRPSSQAQAGAKWTTQPVVISTDVFGNLVSTNTRVLAVLVSGTGPLSSDISTGAVASGATATFSGLSIGATGSHVIGFQCNSLSTCTAVVVGDPPFATKLAFTTQPTGGNVGIGTVVVAVQDSNGATVPTATDPVTISLTPANNTEGATISGTLTKTPSLGLATFASNPVNTVGNYTLDAAATGLTGATSAAFDVTAPSGTNIPTDVTMVTLVSADLTTEALNTVWTNNSSHLGMTQGTGFANMTVRLISDQAWRTNTTAATIPACPNGLDRILVCQITPQSDGAGGFEILAGEKGILYKASPANCKTQYLRWYGLVSSNWVGQAAGSLKKFYHRTQAAGSSVFIYKGIGTASLQGGQSYQSPLPNGFNSAGQVTRNAWVKWEIVAVCPSTAGGSDGHMTVYRDGVKTFQGTNFPLGATTWAEWQFLNYYGGVGDTPIPLGQDRQYSIVGDQFYFAYSTSRAAIPA
jgi:hypothetical protein